VTRTVRTLGILGVAALLVLGSGPAVRADAEAEKAKLVRELIAMTGADRIGTQIMDALIQQFRQVYKDVPPEYWKDLRSTVQDEELRERIVPLYAEHFSGPELKELLAFYRSPLGKKLVSELPEITQQSIAIGQEWGKQQTGKLLEKLKADGYQPAPRK
jgi:uncharacterized protein